MAVQSDGQALRRSMPALFPTPPTPHASVWGAISVRTTLTRPSRTVSMSIPRTTGLPGGPKRQALDGGVGTDVRQAVLLQHEVRRSIVENLLGAVVERLTPHDLAF